MLLKKSSISKTIRSLILISLFFLISCGDPLPILELTNAKQEISRAEKFKAKKFALSEYDEAKENLLAAHNAASESKPDNSKIKKSATYSWSKAQDAIERALPSLIAEVKQEVEAILSEANDAYAEKLAADDFQKSNDLKLEAEKINVEAERLLRDYKQKKDEKEKIEVRNEAFDAFEKEVDKFIQVIDFAKRSRDLSLGQISQVIDSTTDIEENIQSIEKYSEGSSDDTDKLKSSYNDAVGEVKSGKIKSGTEKFETIRTESYEVLSKVIVVYANKRVELARSKIFSGEEVVSKIDRTLAEKFEELRNSLNAAEDNLQAAKEALKSSEDLIEKEKFKDSIEQSNEAIRLADIYLEQSESLAELERKIKLEEEARIAEENRIAELKKLEAEEAERLARERNARGLAGAGKNKTYTVKRKIPSETLWRISAYKQHYGNPNLWRKIYNANKKKLKSPHLIYPKQVLVIPDVRETGKTKKGKIKPRKVREEVKVDDKPPVSSPKVKEPETKEDVKTLEENHVDEGIKESKPTPEIEIESSEQEKDESSDKLIH